MEPANVFIALRRNWVPALLVMVAAVVAAASSSVKANVDPTYRSEASLLLVSSPQATAGDTPRVNPLARIGAAERITTNLIAQVLNSHDGAVEVARAGARGDYAIEPDTFTPGEPTAPILNIRTSASTADGAVRTARAVVNTVKAELTRRQAAIGAPRDTWMQAELLAGADRAVAVRPDTSRVSAGILALGAFAAVSLAFMLEALATRRHEAHDLARPAPVTLSPNKPRPPNAGAGDHSDSVVVHR